MAEPLVVTLGCRLNAFESEVIRREAAAAGTDAVIVNTCAVTGEAVRQARQTIRKLRRRHPERRIIVTGCAAQLAPESFRRDAGGRPGARQHREARPRTPCADGGQPLAVADIMTVRETAAHLLDGFEGRARAFVEVQQGCDHRCTFCIIPFARGPNRSVVAGRWSWRGCAGWSRAGYREIVLTGVDICSWGTRPARDSPTLGSLARAVLADGPGAAAAAAVQPRSGGYRRRSASRCWRTSRG